MRVLVVEDHDPLARSITQGLTESGYAVDRAGDGEEGLALAAAHPYDVILLDLMLPRLDGLSVLRRYRDGGGRAGVLILTARDRVADRVEGLDRGADDYLVKPFAFDELKARVRALARRGYQARSPVIEVGDLAVDTSARVVRRGGRPIPLTAREYALLELLALQAGRVVSRRELQAHLYGAASPPASNVVDVYIGYLRRKLERDPRHPLIRTRRGMGYVLGKPE